MIVAMDVTHLRQSRAGIARYIRGLLGALNRRTDLTMVPIGGGRSEKPGTLSKKLLTARLDLAWYPLLARREARSASAAVLHCPAPRGPLSRGRPPSVMTIHDLVPFRFPETMTRWSRVYSRATHRRMAHAADLIICPSRDTAQDVERYLGVPHSRLRIVPLGVDRFFFETPAGQRQETERPYFLFVGSQELRKNLDRLVQAVALLRSKGFPHELVIAGGDSWGPATIHADFIRKVGHVSEDDLRQLYANAACLALPSLHEGFGLPALEAMAAGTPVVAGRAGALPEITGTAAVLVDPLDVTDIAHGLERTLLDGMKLRAAGLAHAAKYTWEATAAATVAVYSELA